MTAAQESNDARRNNLADDLSKEGLSAGLTVAFQVSSGSMFPTIAAGDVLHIQKVDAERLQAGDFVFISAGSQTLVHRFHRYVRHNAGQGIVTKGEYILAEDPVWPPSAILGRVVSVEKDRKTWDIGSRWGRFIHRFISFLVLVEWRLIGRLPRRAITILHKLFIFFLRFIVKMVWLTR